MGHFNKAVKLHEQVIFNYVPWAILTRLSSFNLHEQVIFDVPKVYNEIRINHNLMWTPGFQYVISGVQLKSDHSLSLIESVSWTDSSYVH